MSCRTLVVALVLLVSPPALAQSPDSDGGASDVGQDVTGADVDSEPDAVFDAGAPPRWPRPALAGLRDACRIDADGDGVIEGVGECPPVVRPVVPADGRAIDTGPRWTVDLDTVAGAYSEWGPWHTVVTSSSLASVRYRAVDGWSIGAVVPFGVGQERVGPCPWPTSPVSWCEPGPPGIYPYAYLGAASLFANWTARPGPATQLQLGMLVALPTTLVSSSLWVEDFAIRFVEPVRGFEDDVGRSLSNRVGRARWRGVQLLGATVTKTVRRDVGRTGRHMSCRTLVVALLASSSAVADLPPERESDAAPDGGSAAPVSAPGIIEPGARGAGTDGPRHQGERTPEPAATSPEPRWSVDLDTVLGSYSGLQVTSIATARWRPLGRLRVGVSVPFLIGGGPPVECWTMPGSTNRCSGDSVQSLGNVAVSAAWETRLGPHTRLPVGLLLALPTAVGTVTNPQYPDPFWYRTAAAAMSRGLEDGELFAPASFAIVPSVGVLQDLGDVVELSASARLPVVPSARGPLLNGVATVQLMYEALAEPRRPRLFIGLRGTAAFRSWPYSEYWSPGSTPPVGWNWLGAVFGERTWSIAFGPRFEARIGPVQLHLGFFLAFHGTPGFGGQVEAPVPGMSLGAGFSL